MKITQAPACSYLNDSYRIWLAQTQNSRAASLNQAEAAVYQAKYARSQSFAYNYGSYIKEAEEYARPYALGAMNTIYSTLSSPFQSLLGSSKSTTSNEFGGGKSAGSGAGIDLNTMQKNIQESPYGISGIQNAPEAFASVYDLATAYINKQIGIETTYEYDFNVQNAQLNMNKLIAGGNDKSRIPATAVGSNAYGDACAYQQYGFMIAVFTPTAEYAEIIDKMLTASGHTINKHIFFTRSHQYFDFIAMPSPEIVSNINDRPEWVRKMLIGLLQSGVYIWHVKDGDISDHFGIPYGLPNPSV